VYSIERLSYAINSDWYFYMSIVVYFESRTREKKERERRT
jgi:hypothetical protein